MGARPQFIKAATISRQLRDVYSNDANEVIIHTGQHVDQNMSQIFFDQLYIPRPKYNLEIFGGSHGLMTGRMISEIENVLLTEKPDYVLIYGDTNSTLAGALAAVKLHIPIAHIEAGLRSFNMKSPEEINRILADRISALLFCPTTISVDHLKNEGIVKGVHNVGDVMLDAALFYAEHAKRYSTLLNHLSLTKGNYALFTCHRAENTDDIKRLKSILESISIIAKNIPVIFPLHPRTRKKIQLGNLNDFLKNLIIIDPVPFLDMISLEKNAAVILTDSGGVQKEAFFYQVPCITLRDETEWTETVELGFNQLVGANFDQIIEAFENTKENTLRKNNVENIYGCGNAAEKICRYLLNK